MACTPDGIRTRISVRNWPPIGPEVDQSISLCGHPAGTRTPSKSLKGSRANRYTTGRYLFFAPYVGV